MSTASLRKMKIQKLRNPLYPTTVLLLIIFLCACAPTPDYIRKERLVVGVDFTKYQKKGFLITPGEYGEDYESIGYLYFTIFPDATNTTRTAGKVRCKGRWYMGWCMGDVDYQEVLDLVYETAMSKGANALTHLKMKSINKTPNFFDAPTIRGLEVSGLLIKRK